MTTVLVLEDDADTREALAESLEAHGYQVRPCCDRDEALAEARRHPVPDLILSDLHVPGEGRAFARLVKQDPALSNIPIFMTTGNPLTTFDEVRQLGVDAIFHKPFDVEELLRAIGRVAQPVVQG